MNVNDRKRLRNYIKTEDRIRLFTTNLFIDVHGRVTNVDGMPSNEYLMNGKPHLVRIPVGESSIRISAAKAMVIAFKNIRNLSRDDLPNLKVLYLDGDVNNIHPANLTYRFIKPQPSVAYPDFYLIPGATKYGLNDEGILLNLESGRTHAFTYHANRKKATILDDFGKYLLLSLSRARALIYHPYPAEVDELEADHIDADVTNDDVSNIQWLTQSENSGKEKKVSKKGKGHNVDVWDTIANETMTYPSATAAGKVTGVHYTSIERLCSHSKDKGVAQTREGGDLVFRWNEGDKSVRWPTRQEIQDQMVRSGMAKQVVMYDPLNEDSSRQYVIFDTMGDAARHVGCPTSLVSDACNDHEKIPYKGYQFRYWDGSCKPQELNFHHWPEEELLAMGRDTRISSIVKLVDVNTGEILTATSIGKMGRVVGCSESHIRNCEKYGSLVLGKYKVKIKRLRSFSKK